MKQKSGLGSALRRRIGVPGIPAAGGHPMRQESVLMNSTRLRIFQAIYNSPCSHVRGLSRTVGVAPPSVLWHIGKLVEKGLVRSLQIGRKRIFYPPETIDNEDVGILSLLNPQKVSLAVRTVIENPGVPQAELMRYSGCNGHTLRALAARKVLDVVKDGRHRRYYPGVEIDRRKEEHEHRARRSRHLLLLMLTQEGLAPESIDAGRGFLEIRVRLGTATETLRFRRNPYDFSQR